ncbi:MAG: long-chain fatty acid--CoA ligase [Cytophagales bacterium]|nr:long-chain fatty acid--CoA ligase [Armatimonadota bacterium]
MAAEAAGTAGSDMTSSTINGIFQAVAEAHGDRIALRHKVDKAYQDISYRQLAQSVETVASGLAHLGIVKGDRVALLSENRPEWAITDLAVLALGGIVVPIYPTLPPQQIAYIVGNSEAKALIVSDGKQLKKALEARKDLPELQYLIAIEPGPTSADAGVHTYASITEQGEKNPLGESYKTISRGITAEDVASIVYTSGTTGDPKGAMLTHGNFTFDVQASLDHFRGAGQPVTENDTFLSFLPVCHVFERTTGYYLPLSVGGTIGYSEGVRTLVDDMAKVAPTLMVCVPRVYESFQERVQDAVAKQPANKQGIFQKAIEFGKKYAEKKRSGSGLVGPWMEIQRFVYEKLVYEKLRARFGGRLRFLVSGGAALAPDTARFFEAIGLPIIEGYGMTEASPVMAVNPNRRIKIGTVGIVVPGGEIKIAGDGEILYRGANVMKGYWKNETVTAEMIGADGWLHTGDVGLLDDEGYLKITDRKKDILVLANGKNVAPQPIEAEMKQSPLISEIVLIGDKQNIITALVLPNKEKLKEALKAQGVSVPGTDEELMALPDAKKRIKQEIDALSSGLADFEKIKRFTLLPVTFSVDSGEMTPTLKIKRKVVMQKFAREIAEMRGEAADAAAVA